MSEHMQNGLLIKQLHDRLEKRANNDLRSKDLTMMQVSVLMALRDAPEQQLSMKELERHFKVAQPTAAGIVSRLEEKGFVEACGDADDKRIKVVHITVHGKACCEEAAGYMHKAEETLLRGFSPEEREMFHDLLAKAADNVK